MEQKTFISINKTDMISDLFRKPLRPLNNYAFKPNGGLWASPYGSDKYFISEWHDYIIATKKYPSLHHALSYYGEYDEKHKAIDFELLSRDYDGIYVRSPYIYSPQTVVFENWVVSTLLLFNLQCIESYEKITIDWNKDPFYYNPNYDEECYPYISKTSNLTEVQPNSKEYIELYEIVKTLFINNLLSNNLDISSYDKYFKSLLINAKKTINTILEGSFPLCDEIISKYREKGFNINKEYFIFNIVFNVLADFLNNNRDKISLLPKSKVKTKEDYHSILQR